MHAFAHYEPHSLTSRTGMIVSEPTLRPQAGRRCLAMRTVLLARASERPHSMIRRVAPCNGGTWNGDRQLSVNAECRTTCCMLCTDVTKHAVHPVNDSLDARIHACACTIALHVCSTPTIPATLDTVGSHVATALTLHVYLQVTATLALIY